MSFIYMYIIYIVSLLVLITIGALDVFDLNVNRHYENNIYIEKIQANIVCIQRHNPTLYVQVATSNVESAYTPLFLYSLINDFIHGSTS